MIKPADGIILAGQKDDGCLTSFSNSRSHFISRDAEGFITSSASCEIVQRKLCPGFTTQKANKDCLCIECFASKC